MTKKNLDNPPPLEMSAPQLREEIARLASMHQETKLALNSVLQSYAAFFDQAADGIALLDAEGRIEDVNPALCNMLKRSRGELMALRAQDVIAPEDYKEFPEIFKKVADGSQLVNRCRLVTRVGVRVDVEITAARLPQGRYTAVVRDMRGRTEAERAKLALRERERHYRLLFEQSNDAVFICDATDGRIFNASRRAVELTGYPREQLCTMAIPDLHPAQEIETALHRVRECREQGHTRFESVFKRRDGTLRDVEVSASLVDPDQGLMQGIVRDITEQKQAQRQIREERDRAQAYMDVAGVILVVLDTDGAIQQINRRGCEILGCPAHEAVGRNWFESFIPERGRDPLVSYFQSLMAGHIEGREYNENTVLAAQEEERLIAWHNTLLRNSSGHIAGLLSSGEDITEQREAEIALQRALIETRRSQAELAALLSGTRAVLESTDFQVTARHIFDTCKKLIGATSGYVALLNADGDENEVLFLEAGGRPCTVDPALPMPIRGLRATAYQSGRTVYDNKFMTSEWMRFMPAGHVALDNVLFAPLNIRGRTVGIMGVANKPGGFNDNDAVLATAFGEIAAIALSNHLSLEQLAESEAKHRALFETSPIGIVRTSIDSRFLETNQAFQDMVGYSNEELRAMTFYDITPPEWHEADKAAVREGREIGHNGYEKEYLTKDGRRIPVSVTAWLIRDDKGGIKYVQGFITDITERKKAEQALRRSEHDKALILESMAEIVSFKDPDMRYIWANPSTAAAAGVTPDDMVGRTCFEVCYGTHEPCAGCAVALARDTCRPQMAEVATPDGRVWLSQGYPLYDENAQLEGIIDVSLDITDRKRMEQALRDSEIKYRTLAENTTDLIVRFDNKYRVLYANPAAMTRIGRPLESILGKSTSDLGYDPDLSDFIDESIDLVFEQGEPVQLEFTVQGPVSATPYDTRMVPEFSPDGTVQSVIATMRDISDIKIAEREKDSVQQQLLQAQKMEAIGQLAGGVAHDFNNMLTVIMAGAQLGLMRVDRDSEDFREYSSILEASEKARDLTMKLLTFARKEKLSVRSVPVDTLIKDLLPLLQKSLPASVQPVLDLRCAASALMDRNQVHQALLNVCNNAADAMPSGGTLLIETDLLQLDPGMCPACSLDIEGAYGRIRIRDTGIGIPTHILDKITEPFFTTKGVGKGTGLGLAITHGIITGHDGHLHITSEPGLGTCVEILLPVDASPETAPAPPGIPMAPGAGTETILIVDDEIPILRTTARALEQMGYHTLSVSSGSEALALFREKHHEIHAVLLDLVMPGMDGEEVYRELRKIDPGVRVVLCSGYSAEGLAGRVVSQGVQGFVQKPFSLTTLGKTIRDVLDAPATPRA